MNECRRRWAMRHWRRFVSSSRALCTRSSWAPATASRVRPFAERLASSPRCACSTWATSSTWTTACSRPHWPRSQWRAASADRPWRLCAWTRAWTRASSPTGTRAPRWCGASMATARRASAHAADSAISRSSRCRASWPTFNHHSCHFAHAFTLVTLFFVYFLRKTFTTYTSVFFVSFSLFYIIFWELNNFFFYILFFVLLLRNCTFRYARKQNIY